MSYKNDYEKDLANGEAHKHIYDKHGNRVEPEPVAVPADIVVQLTEDVSDQVVNPDGTPYFKRHKR